jgi:uncharacterized protein YndB with AHSA1/START domain
MVIADRSNRADIIHRIGIQAPIAKVYEGLSTVEGVANWWTREATGESKTGGTIRVCFMDKRGEEVGSMEIQVVALEPNRQVHWRIGSGPAEWVGTEVTFTLNQEAEYAIVLSSHSHWREDVEFTAHCSMKSATFLLSLHQLIETGFARPSPGDLEIDNWN